METKKKKDHKYKVKPGLSINSKDLYRRYRNNSLAGVNTNQQGHSMDHTLLDFTRMEKGQQLDSLKKDLETIEKLKK